MGMKGVYTKMLPLPLRRQIVVTHECLSNRFGKRRDTCIAAYLNKDVVPIGIGREQCGREQCFMR
jgi:hypothetical protein